MDESKLLLLERAAVDLMVSVSVEIVMCTLSFRGRGAWLIGERGSPFCFLFLSVAAICSDGGKAERSGGRIFGPQEIEVAIRCLQVHSG